MEKNPDLLPIIEAQNPSLAHATEKISSKQLPNGRKGQKFNRRLHDYRLIPVTERVTFVAMIKSISSKPLRLFHEKDDASKLPASQLGRISLILGLLDAAVTPSDMDFPGSGLHKLSGELKEYWAVKVSGNYRIIVKFEDEGVTDVDYLDYH